MRKIIALAAALLMLAGCAPHRNIEIVSAGLVSLTPHSLRSADAVVSIQLQNPAPAFKLSDMKAEVLRGGSVMLELSSPDTVSVPARTTTTLTVGIKGSIVGSMSLMELMALLKDRNLDAYTVSYSATYRDFLGFRHKICTENVPLNSYLCR